MGVYHLKPKLDPFAEAELKYKIFEDVWIRITSKYPDHFNVQLPKVTTLRNLPNPDFMALPVSDYDSIVIQTIMSLFSEEPDEHSLKSLTSSDRMLLTLLIDNRPDLPDIAFLRKMVAIQ